MDFRVRDLMVQVLPEKGEKADNCPNFSCGCTCSCVTLCSECTHCSLVTPPPKGIAMNREEAELALLMSELKIAMAGANQDSNAPTELGRS